MSLPLPGGAANLSRDWGGGKKEGTKEEQKPDHTVSAMFKLGRVLSLCTCFSLQGIVNDFIIVFKFAQEHAFEVNLLFVPRFRTMV